MKSLSQRLPKSAFEKLRKLFEKLFVVTAAFGFLVFFPLQARSIAKEAETVAAQESRTAPKFENSKVSFLKNNFSEPDLSSGRGTGPD